MNFSNKVTSTPHKDVSNNSQRFLSSAISYVDNTSIDSENDLSYDSVLSSPGSLASAYIYENTSVPQCYSSGESTYSSENISVLSERTYIYNISSNETSIETLNLSKETSFDADSSEIPSQPSDVTDCSDKSYMQTSDSDTFIYDSSATNSQTSMLQVEHFNQSKEEIGILLFTTQTVIVF